jgi:hypothetical protein
MNIAVGNSRMDKKWKNKKHQPGLHSRTRFEPPSAPRRRCPSIEDDQGPAGLDQDIGGFVGGALREGKRRNGYVLAGPC